MLETSNLSIKGHATRDSIRVPLPYLSLPYLRGEQALTHAQRWCRISSARCASPNVTTRLQITAIKP